MTREKCVLLNVKLARRRQYDVLPNTILLLYGNYELREKYAFKIFDKFYIFWYDIGTYL